MTNNTREKLEQLAQQEIASFTTAQPDRATNLAQAWQLLQADLFWFLVSLAGNCALALYFQDHYRHLFWVSISGAGIYVADRLIVPGRRTTEITVLCLIGAVFAPLVLAAIGVQVK